jgi:tetratricopeptide (TPR) repeat protein
VNNNLQYLKEVEGKLGKVEEPQTSGSWYLYAAAACITLLIVAGIFLWPSQQSTDELYAAHFEPFPNVFQPTLRTERVADLRTEAFGAYEAENYQRAAALFTRLNEQQSDAGILMLLGNANMIIGKHDVARQNFNDLLTKYDELDPAAKWFLSLCHLKTGEPEKARELLQDLQQTQSPYTAKANELLGQLE